MAIINSNPYSYWQWDVGQVFTVPKEYCTFKFLIQNEGSTKSYVSVATTEDQENYEVLIPNIVLQTAGRVLVYYCNGDIDFETEDIDGEIITTIQNLKTIAEQVLWVNKRGKPENYIYTPEDLITYDGLSYQINELKDRCYAIEDYIGCLEADIDDHSVSIENLRTADMSLNKRISNIEQHINQDYFITDDSIAYTKEIPLNVCSYAQLNAIGGMTYKCDNLLKLVPPNNNPWTQDLAVCQFDNGIITVDSSGLMSKTVTFTFETEIELLAGEDYWVSSGQSNTSPTTWRMYIAPTVQGAFASKYTITDQGIALGPISVNTGCKIYIQVFAGAEPKNIVFTPTISYASIASDGTQYFEGLRDTKVTKVISHGANLIPFPYYSKNNFQQGGITYRYDEEGKFNITGTTTTAAEFFLFTNKQLEPGTYCIKEWGKPENGFNANLSVRKNGSWVENFNDGRIDSNTKLITLTEEDVKKGSFYLNVYVHTDFSGSHSEPYAVMFTKGNQIPTEYKLYREPITYEIPLEIQNTDGYGNGISEKNYNYIEWNDERINSIRHSIREAIKNLSVSETTITGGKHFITIQLGSEPYGDPFGYGLSDKLNIVRKYADELTLGEAMISPSSKSIYFRTDLDIAQFRTQYDNAIIEYVLAEPITQTLHANFDNIIEVEACGRLEFFNEYKNVVPTSITYLTKEGGI